MIKELIYPVKDMEAMRSYFLSGETLSYAFRKNQLEKLKQILISNEKQIFDALFLDLKKGPEESYATETGLVIAEIAYTLKRLHKWMQPQKMKTNFLNFPSSTRIYPEPLGVTLIISSWNYPVYLLLTPFVGAIASGNCAVLKPSEGAPATSSVIARLIKENFDSKYVKVVEGEGSIVVPALMEAIRFDHIFYTGSTNVGKSIYEAAAKDLIPVTLELGGKSPAIVEQDADIKTTAKRIVLGKFINAGQTCVAPDYLLVHKQIEAPLLNELTNQIKIFFGDNPLEGNNYGKIINENRFNHLLSYLDNRNKIFYGGSFNRDKLQISPTLMTDVSSDDAIMQEEIFGPLLPILTYQDNEAALSVIRKNEKPLSFYLFTKNKSNQKWWMQNASFGGGCINNTLWHLSNPNIPFGGVGNSGIGAYHGKYSFDTFTHYKAVMHTPTWFDPGIKYPPFKGKLNLFKRFIK
ncbi:MAG: aldehyde dehydrogenase [Bacteroidetes bacterium]|nr:aldehyde dehydrogenase [Bacteroidota bacterium]